MYTFKIVDVGKNKSQNTENINYDFSYITDENNNILDTFEIFNCGYDNLRTNYITHGDVITPYDQNKYWFNLARNCAKLFAETLLKNKNIKNTTLAYKKSYSKIKDNYSDKFKVKNGPYSTFASIRIIEKTLEITIIGDNPIIALHDNDNNINLYRDENTYNALKKAKKNFIVLINYILRDILSKRTKKIEFDKYLRKYRFNTIKDKNPSAYVLAPNTDVWIPKISIYNIPIDKINTNKPIMSITDGILKGCLSYTEAYYKAQKFGIKETITQSENTNQKNEENQPDMSAILFEIEKSKYTKTI